ncbi:MAG TPA: PAS domain-containing sensor histidine kinase [Patescibacteria group bacterium]|nr:PAS domain-containing sensor histidine kinase [Patescibacteria group bacterium]
MLKFKKKKELVKDIQFFLDALGDGVFIVDQQGTIVKTNKAASEILGFDQYELLGRLFLSPLGAVDESGNPIDKKNAALFVSLKEGKKINNVTRQFTKKNGDWVWTSITTTPIIKKRKVIGGIVVFRDISAQKQQEEYHLDFAHIASHSLRAPLGNVMWAFEYFMSGRLGPLSKKYQDYVNDIYTKLKEMNSMVNDLLGISRLQHNKIKPKLEKTSLDETIKKVIADLDHYAKSQNVKIKVKISQNKNNYVMADPYHLRTIVQNLIENAIRYSFPRTVIEISTGKKDKDIIFACKNEGIGIPKDKYKFIFAKFFRAKNAVDKQGSGTGMGLYLTKEMVILNQGEIWFESIINKDTTFFVKLKTL